MNNLNELSATNNIILSVNGIQNNEAKNDIVLSKLVSDNTGNVYCDKIDFNVTTWTEIPGLHHKTLCFLYVNGVWYVGCYVVGLWKSTDFATWTKVNDIPNTHIKKLIYENGIYLAINNQNVVYRSLDGNTWENITAKLPTGSTGFVSIAYSNGLWVCKLDGLSGLWKSTDAMIWTQTAKTDGAFSSIKYANGLWLAGSGNGDGLWKSTDGNTWVKCQEFTFSSVVSIFCGNGTFVIYPRDESFLYKTTNGIIFEKFSRNYIGTNGGGVVYANDVWFIFGYNGIYLSYNDGKTWDKTISDAIYGMYYANGYLLRSSGTNVVGPTNYYTSSSKNLVPLIDEKNQLSADTKTLSISNNILSANTIVDDVFEQTSKTNGRFPAIYYANGLWLAGNDENGGIWKSTDGNTWTQTTKTDGNWVSIYYANGLWLVGSFNNAGIWKSTDGNTWTQTDKTDGHFLSIHYANGLWLAGSEKLGIWKSTDGNTWTQTAKTDGSPCALYYANGLWLAGNDGDNKGSLWKSTDGNTWVADSHFVRDYIFGVHYAAGMWIVATWSKGIWKSTDGNTWIQTDKTDGSFYPVAYANGLWLAGQYRSEKGIWMSIDGENWIQTSNKTGQQFSLCYANGLWLVGSCNGTGILKSKIRAFHNPNSESLENKSSLELTDSILGTI